MDTSIIGDKIIVLWQVLVFGCVLGGIFFLLPWFLGRLYRWRGIEPPSLGRRIMTCTLVVLITVFVSYIVSYIVIVLLFIILGAVLGTFRAGDEWILWSVFLPLWIGSLVAICIILVRLFLSESAEGHRWISNLIALGLAICVMGIYLCAMPSIGRTKTLAKRSIDGGNLSGIGHVLAHYHEEHGEYPDDLRRLVDDGRDAQLLLSRYGTSKDEIPDPWPVPYDGPCDFVYIRLPDEAPDDLVWVWQPVKYNEDEGGWVLLKDTGVRWMQAEKLKAEVARTHKWLEAHPTTQPATATSR